MTEIADLTDRELNSAVAEEVMGWTEWDGETDYDGPYPMFCVWEEEEWCAVYGDQESGDVTSWFAPATDIAAAWEVVEKLDGLFPGSELCLWNYGPRPWSFRVDGKNYSASGWAGAATPARAICEAALAAIRSREKKEE